MSDSIASVHSAAAMVPRNVVPPEPHSCNVPLSGAVQPGVSVSIIDSIGADTVAGQVPRFALREYTDSVRADIIADAVATGTARIFVPGGADTGLPPRQLNAFPAGGPALTALLTGVLLAVAFSGNAVKRAMRIYRINLLSVRRRNNAFDGTGRVPSLLAVLPALLFVVFGGTALYFGLGMPVAPSFTKALAIMGILSAYYVFQLVAYNLLGYSFSTPDGRRQWVEGFSASQAYAGLLLVAPALLLLCMPQYREPLAGVAAGIYVVSRLVFVYKGFRIFYRKLRSLLYFGLYLVCMELIPPMTIIAVVSTFIQYR